MFKTIDSLLLLIHLWFTIRPTFLSFFSFFLLAYLSNRFVNCPSNSIVNCKYFKNSSTLGTLFFKTTSRSILSYRKVIIQSPLTSTPKKIYFVYSQNFLHILACTPHASGNTLSSSVDFNRRFKNAYRRVK